MLAAVLVTLRSGQRAPVRRDKGSDFILSSKIKNKEKLRHEQAFQWIILQDQMEHGIWCQIMDNTMESRKERPGKQRPWVQLLAEVGVLVYIT